MASVRDIPPERAARLRGFLFDLDDTLLTGGCLTEEAYQALWRLKESGLELIGVTGRPAAWGQLLAGMWPVAGVITENGAVAYARDEKRVVEIDTVPPPERALRRERLQRLAALVQAQFPELHATEDAGGRISDYTFDIAEHCQVSDSVVSEASEFARGHGARTSRSSIHLHISFDGADKASGVLAFLMSRFGEDPTAALGRWAYVGDSENDAPCFAAFRLSIGVRNLRGRPTVGPRYRTEGAMGAGLAEAAREILRARGR